MRWGDFINGHHVPHIFPASVQADNGDMFNGDPATTPVNMKNFRYALFVIQCGTGAVGTSKITVQRDNTAAFGSGVAIPFKYRAQTTIDTWGAWTDATAATGFTTAAAADKCYEVLVDAADLGASGDNFISLITAEQADGAVHGSIVCFLFGARYAKDIPATAIA